MIEAVNASLASASLVRAVVDQAESVRSYAANPTQVQQVPQAPYVSPYVSMNYTIDKAVLQFRDSESGEVVAQIPSDTQLRAYRRAAEQQPIIFKPKAEQAEDKAESVKPAADTADVKVESDSASAPAPVEIEAAPVSVDTTA